MAAIDLNHYNIRAPRDLLDEIRDFYCGLLELRVGPRPPLKSSGYWLYAGERAILHLVIAEDRETRRSSASTIDHVAFTCTDYEAMRSKLDTAGIAYRTSDVPTLKLRQVFFQDPAGNGVELNFG